MGMETTVHAFLAGQIQAIWITAFFDGEISHLRSDRVVYNAVRYETVLQTVYQQLRGPREVGGAGGKYPEYVFDSLVYVDTLLRDLGLNSWRKPTLWKEYFESYRPKDYRGLVHEWMEKTA